MALTPETLARHELVGLDVAVVAAPNPDLLGLTGRVVAETTRTIGIETDTDTTPEAETGTGTEAETETRPGAESDAEMAVVPKAETTFEWTLPDGETVRTAGRRLLARPARRSERPGDSTWR